MGVPIGSLGSLVFSVSADQVKNFDSLSRSKRAVYADHDIAGGKQASEFTGLDLEDATLSMVFNATLGISPEEEFKNLEEMLVSAEAHHLMLGNASYGKYTIREIGAVTRQWLGGASLVMTVEVTLKEYDDQQQGPGADAMARDAATQSSSPTKVPGASAPTRQRSCALRK